MDYNWPLFDGAHVLIRPKGMTAEQLQEGYRYFLREAYSLTGIMRRFRGGALDLPSRFTHFMHNYLVSRYGMTKVAHAIRGEEFDVPEIDGTVSEQTAGAAPVRVEEPIPVHAQEPMRVQEPVHSQEPARVREQPAAVRAVNVVPVQALDTPPIREHAPRRPAPAVVPKAMPAVDGS